MARPGPAPLLPQPQAMAPLATIWGWQLAIAGQALAWQMLALRGWTALAGGIAMPAMPAMPAPPRAAARASTKPNTSPPPVTRPDDADVEYLA